MRTLLFVYGTLKRGGRLHGHMAGGRFVAEAATVPRYRLLRVGWYPGLVDAAGGTAVVGELWEVEADHLRRLDDVEGVAEGLFERRSVELQVAAGAEVQAYFYARSAEGLPDAGECWDVSHG